MSVPITKPTVGASNGTWGTEANAVFDALNAADYFAVKTADVSRSSVVTLADDTGAGALVGLSLPVGTFVVNASYLVSGAAAGDFKVGWVFGGTATLAVRSGSGPLDTTTSVKTATAAVTVGVNRSAAAADTAGTIGTGTIYGVDGTNWSAIQETGVLVVTVAGALKVQWSQGTTSATATILRAGSYLWARQVA